MLPNGPTSFKRPTRGVQLAGELLAPRVTSSRHRVAANDNKRPAKLIVKQWLGKLWYFLLPMVGAAILIFAMTHA